MVPTATHALAAFQVPSALPLQSSFTHSQFLPRDRAWWPSSECADGPMTRKKALMARTRPTMSMALGFSASVAALLPKQFYATSVAPALQGLGELLPVVGAPMITVLCLSAATWLLSMLASFVARSFTLWWTMAIRSRRALPSGKISLATGGAVQLENLKSDYRQVSAVRQNALTRINELSKSLETVQDGINEGAQTARSRVQFLESRLEAVKEISSTTLNDAPTRASSAGLMDTYSKSPTVSPSELGNARSAEMERAAVATVTKPSFDIGVVAGEAVGDQWEVVMESGGGKYALLRHRHHKTSIELPLFGMGVLFAGGQDSVVRRCWADGTLYERFSFHSGTTLLEAVDEAPSTVSRKLLSDPDGVSLGAWLVEEGEGFILIKSSKHDEELVLLQDGFAFFGGGSRGVVVRGDAEPEVERTSLLRHKIGLPDFESVKSTGAEQREQPVVAQAAHDVPEELVCPLSHEVMSDPWIATDGFSYERKAIEDWFARKGARSPTTGLPLPDTRLLPNNALRSIIATYVEQ